MTPVRSATWHKPSSPSAAPQRRLRSPAREGSPDAPRAGRRTRWRRPHPQAPLWAPRGRSPASSWPRWSLEMEIHRENQQGMTSPCSDGAVFFCFVFFFSSTVTFSDATQPPVSAVGSWISGVWRLNRRSACAGGLNGVSLFCHVSSLGQKLLSQGESSRSFKVLSSW